MSETQVVTAAPANTARQVLFASMIGTTIEFFDFYIYATAAVLVFPGLVFSEVRSGLGYARLARDVWDRVPGAAGGLGALRPLRRPRRAEGDIGRGAANDGCCPRSRSAFCRPIARLALLRRCCSRSAALARGSDSEASGAARCCWRSRMRLRGSAPGTACFLSLARLSDFSFPEACSCFSPDGSPTSSSSLSVGDFHFWRVRCWCSSASTCG